jgi:arabinofuranan 3-O-arabinosyltransferase
MIAEERADESRIRTIASIWAIAAGLFYCYDILRDTGATLTTNGRPLGDDFVNYWSGAFLAWHGRAADVYNWPTYHAFQQSIVGDTVGAFHYSYPPVLFILTAPLAALPYLPGLAPWLAAGWFAFYRALWMALPGREALLLAFATPAVFINAYGGQNGTWTAAFIGGGLCMIERRPFVAGMLFGLMIYKPHLALLIPVALLAGRQWSAIAGSMVSACTLVLVSVMLFGTEVWREYAQFAAHLRYTILEDGSGVWHRMVSVFVFARRLGADVSTAYAVQAAMGLIAAGLVAFAWLRNAPMPLKSAVLILGTFLVTPYLQDYDLVLGAFVVVWLMRPEMLAHYSERAAQIACGLVLTLPLLASVLGNTTGLAFGPLFVLPAFILSARALLCAPLLISAATTR